jgi:hypothetical protein
MVLASPAKHPYTRWLFRELEPAPFPGPIQVERTAGVSIKAHHAKFEVLDYYCASQAGLHSAVELCTRSVGYFAREERQRWHAMMQPTWFGIALWAYVPSHMMALLQYWLLLLKTESGKCPSDSDMSE